ncbi:uncharacterized protein LOC115436698 [Sphaeramia orbicularis]|uniref:Uncharacterized LOC115436698 n=1 Tax=Sphaeramia orbicularis TaxID=375764 RepID=A0A673CMK7_9TELE|nr:uncharacterized protein LOC115436698 [Sphaeramia orbicularis]
MVTTCVAVGCNNRQDKNAGKSFYRFPKDPERRGLWTAAVKREGWQPSSTSRVCSDHFIEGKSDNPKSPDYVPSLFSHLRSPQKRKAREHLETFKRRSLTKTKRKEGEASLDSTSPDFVPSVFMFTKQRQNPKPKMDRVRVCERRPRAERAPPVHEEEVEVLTLPPDHDYCRTTTTKSAHQLAEEKDALDPQIQALQLRSCFGLKRFAGSDEDIRFYTRFHSYDHLMAFWRLIEPATSKMIRVTNAKEASVSVAEKTTSYKSIKLLPIDEFFLFLTYLSTGSTQTELGHQFNIHRTTASRIITSWANFLYCLLGAVCIWMTPEEITAKLPPEFKDYADTQVIVDTTELRCQTPSSHCTFKAMIGMAPHGPLTFVSALYGGSISDRELFSLSGIIPLLSPDMAVMVDEGFQVDDLVPGKLHRPAFCSNKEQMAAHDILETQSIARLRVHIERLVRRVKDNKLFDTVIPLSISGSINQLFTVACILCNYQNGPLVKD